MWVFLNNKFLDRTFVGLVLQLKLLKKTTIISNSNAGVVNSRCIFCWKCWSFNLVIFSQETIFCTYTYIKKITWHLFNVNFNWILHFKFKTLMKTTNRCSIGLSTLHHNPLIKIFIVKFSIYESQKSKMHGKTRTWIEPNPRNPYRQIYRQTSWQIPQIRRSRFSKNDNFAIILEHAQH